LKFRNFVFETFVGGAILGALVGGVLTLRFLDFLGFSERSKSANGEKRDVRGKPPSTRREEAGGALASTFILATISVLTAFELRRAG